MYRIGVTAVQVFGLAACGLAIWILSGSLTAVSAVSASDITIVQSDEQLVINVSNPTGEFLLWRYSYVPSSSSCDNSSQFLVIAPEDSDDGQASVRLTPADSRLDFCLKISNQDTSEETFKTFQPRPLASDNQPPSISVRRPDNQTLSVTSRDADLDATSWTYSQFGSNPNCRTATVNTGLPEQRTNELALTEADNGRWYCFSVRDVNGNRAWAEYRVEDVDTSAPELTISQDGRILRAESEEAASGWIYIASPSDIDCNADTFLNNRSAVSGQQVTLTTERINYYYCFRASDTGGNDGFVKYRVGSVDFLSAKIQLRQVGLAIIAESDKSIESWSYVRADAKINCGNETNFEEAVDFSDDRTISLNPDDHQHFFCVRGVNKTNTASFAILEANILAIKIKLEIDDGEILIASAEGETLDWSYFKSEDEPDCDESNRQAFESPSFDNYRGSSSQLNSLDNDLWFCVQAVDSFGNAGYAKKRISGITTAPPGDETATSRGQTDIIIITAASIVAGLGVVVFIFLSKRRQAMPAIDAFTVRNETTRRRQPKKKAQKEKPTEDDETIQPLDYLKGDDDK